MIEKNRIDHPGLVAPNTQLCCIVSIELMKKVMVEEESSLPEAESLAKTPRWGSPCALIAQPPQSTSYLPYVIYSLRH